MLIRNLSILPLCIRTRDVIASIALLVAAQNPSTSMAYKLEDEESCNSFRTNGAILALSDPNAHVWGRSLKELVWICGIRGGFESLDSNQIKEVLLQDRDSWARLAAGYILITQGQFEADHAQILIDLLDSEGFYRINHAVLDILALSDALAGEHLLKIAEVKAQAKEAGVSDRS